MFVFQGHAIVSVVHPSRTEPLLPVYATEGDGTPVELPVVLPVFAGAKEEDGEGYP